VVRMCNSNGLFTKLLFLCDMKKNVDVVRTVSFGREALDELCPSHGRASNEIEMRRQSGHPGKLPGGGPGC
jgi:hypothetical protein